MCWWNIVYNSLNFVKNIEVKQVISPNSSRIAENIRHGFEQLACEGGGTSSTDVTQGIIEPIYIEGAKIENFFIIR